MEYIVIVSAPRRYHPPAGRPSKYRPARAAGRRVTTLYAYTLSRFCGESCSSPDSRSPARSRSSSFSVPRCCPPRKPCLALPSPPWLHPSVHPPRAPSSTPTPTDIDRQDSVPTGSTRASPAGSRGTPAPCLPACLAAQSAAASAGVALFVLAKATSTHEPATTAAPAMESGCGVSSGVTTSCRKKDMRTLEVRRAEAGPTRVPLRPTVTATCPASAHRPPPTIASQTSGHRGTCHGLSSSRAQG
eukprot:scaffold27440_cov124-Isochrysis_galbana.AAC.2